MKPIFSKSGQVRTPQTPVVPPVHDPGGNGRLWQVKVEIVDVNDNAPVIELVDGRIRLYESAELGSELYVGAARDADSQRYGIDSCQLTPNSVQSVTNTTAAAAHVTAFFVLVVRRRLDDVRVVDLYVRLTSTLDRETFGDSLVSMACRMSVNQSESDAITCLYTTCNDHRG